IRAGMDWTMGHSGDSDRLEYGLALTLFLLRRGLYTECEARLIQAEPVAQRLGDKAALANFLNRRGLVGWNRSDYAAAEPHFEAARLLCREIDDQSLFLKVLANLGNVSWGRSDFVKARRIWEEALELAVTSGHARQEGTYRTNLAILACYRGEYETSEQYYQDGLALYQRVEFVEGIAFARYNFSELLLYRQEHDRALEQAEESLRLFSLLSDRQGIALTTIRIGLLRLETGRYAEAGIAFAAGLAQAEEIGIRRCEMYAWEGLARLSDIEGDLKTAQERFRRSLSIAGEVGDRRHCAVTLVRLAKTLLQRERASEAYRLLLFAHAEYTTLHLAEIDQVESLKEALRARLGPTVEQALRKAPAQSLEALLEKTCYN
ncbi:MAG: helix-turn-helix protein, partial [Chthonomonadales bacterium]|nr:helix-turn-helix protein [Chthonomonadales bacterium]